MADFWILVNEIGYAHPILSNDCCRNTDSRLAGRYILQDYCICADIGMIAYVKASQYLGSRTDIDMPADYRRQATGTRPYRHLLKNKAIGADHGIRVNHYAVGVWQQQPPTNSGSERDIGTRGYAPDTMAYDSAFHANFAEDAGS